MSIFVNLLLFCQFCQNIFYPSGLDLIFLPVEILHEHSEAVVRRCSVKKVFLEISKDSRKNTCARVSFLIKLQASASRCSPANFAKLIRTPFFTEHFWWLLLKIKMLCTLTLFTQDLLNTSLFSKEFLKFKKRDENM